MLINYYGHSYFLLQGDEYSIALDPFKNVGLIEPKITADYVFKSHDHFDHNNLSLVSGAKLIDKSSGKFEIIQSYHDEVGGKKRGINNVLKFSLDGKTLVFMGDIGVIDKNVIEKTKNCDYLFIPVGGTYTIDEVLAKEYAIKINAKCVIPMHYKVDSSTVDVKSVTPFLNLFDSYVKVKSPYKTSGEERGVYNVEY